MLVLSRQREETIMIGDDIQITVVDIRGDKVRLGINAPARIAVHRKEVYDAIKAENQRAAGTVVELPSSAVTASVSPGRRNSDTLGRLAPLTAPTPINTPTFDDRPPQRATGTDGPIISSPASAPCRTPDRSRPPRPKAR